MGIDSTPEARARVRILGQVQGVGFRYFVVQHARPLGLTGWVRNREDDSVEVLAEGSRAQLEELLALLRQGPPRAAVEGFEVAWSEPAGDLRGFSIRRF